MQATTSARPAATGRAWIRLGYAVMGFVALAFGWNEFARRFDERSDGLRFASGVYERAAANLRATLTELPPPAAPRIVLYGSSQIAVVKGDSTPDAAIPHRLHDALSRRGTQAEVVDFSDGAEQVVESLALHVATSAVSKPTAVVIGVTLFSMLHTSVRPILLSALDVTTVRAELLSLLAPGADPADVDALLAFTRRAEAAVEGRGKTLQERADARIGDWLTPHLAAYRNRQSMFDLLVDRPIRQDFRKWITRTMTRQRTARAYQIGAAYGPSLLALEALQAATTRDGAGPLLVVALPFDATRPPAPFDAATQERVLDDLRVRAARSGFELLDLSSALASERFGDFVDGSPDNLHYDARGHEIVADRIADALARRRTR